MLFAKRAWLLNEVVSAQYTLAGDVFRMDAKEEPTGMY